MKTERKIKATQLPKYKQIQVGRFYALHKPISFKDVQLHFGITYDQCRRACLKYESGEVKRVKSARPIEVRKVKMKFKNADEILDSQYYHALSQLEADEKMPASDRIPMLDKLFSARKTIQSLRLEKHMKRNDAIIVVNIIRRFLPEASEEDCIKIFYEEVAKWKNKI